MKQSIVLKYKEKITLIVFTFCLTLEKNIVLQPAQRALRGVIKTVDGDVSVESTVFLVG